MLEFKKLGKDVEFLRSYFEKSKISFCDLTVGTKYLWRDEFRIEYAVVDDTLIMKEDTKDYQNAFYYPIGKNVGNALKEIENYVVKKSIPFVFCCIDNVTATALHERYKKIEIVNDRNWSDYIYDAESFKAFSGKKYGGQRNHINKFKKTYPDYEFVKITTNDIAEIKEFISDFEAENDFSMWSAKEEDEKIRDYIDNFARLNQLGGAIKTGGKIIAVSFGETVGDTLVVHVEKALKKYDGVYPTMANEFAKAFAVGKITKINREEDCGDMGLRISKLQYHPIEIKEKNVVKVDL